MTAPERVRPTIKLTSPDGSEFSALWSGSSRNREKKLGNFTYPDFPGTIIQDLDWNGWQYPMNITFTGPDHDQEAERFATATNERGQWQVVHPVKGTLALQMATITENNLPVEFAASTSFDITWLEPANIEIILSAEEVATTTETQAKKSNASLGDQLKQLKQDTFAKIQAAKNTIDSVTTTINGVLGPIAQTVTEVNTAFNQITRSIQTALDAAILQPLNIAAQITQLTQLPGLVSSDFQARFENYKNLAEELFGLSPDGTTDEDFNRTLIQELSLGAVMVASGQIAASSEFTTRSQVLDAIDQSNSLFSDTVQNLDLIQKQFENKDIDLQYFSQSQSYNDILLLNSLALRFLIESTFDLAVEKRFILKKRRSPLEITVTEYGSLGENDINYDLFLASNNLKSNDIIILPPGREVVVYV